MFAKLRTLLQFLKIDTFRFVSFSYYHRGVLWNVLTGKHIYKYLYNCVIIVFWRMVKLFPLYHSSITIEFLEYTVFVISWRDLFTWYQGCTERHLWHVRSYVQWFVEPRRVPYLQHADQWPGTGRRWMASCRRFVSSISVVTYSFQYEWCVETITTWAFNDISCIEPRTIIGAYNYRTETMASLSLTIDILHTWVANRFDVFRVICYLKTSFGSTGHKVINLCVIYCHLSPKKTVMKYNDADK